MGVRNEAEQAAAADEIVERYVGRIDGDAAERTVAVLREAVAECERKRTPDFERRRSELAGRCPPLRLARRTRRTRRGAKRLRRAVAAALGRRRTDRLVPSAPVSNDHLEPQGVAHSFEPKPQSHAAPPVRYCKRCVMPETKPDLSIDEEGICDACRSAEVKNDIDWDARREELRELLERYRSADGSNYDCIVPVSGGKDSTFQVMTILELGYRPLLVTWSACAYTDIGRKNIENMQKLGADHIQFTPNPKVYRAMFAEAFRRVGDGCWPCHVGIFSYPVRVAVNYGVPLLVYGENPQLEYGGPAADAHDNTIDREWLEEFGGLLGNRIDDMVGVNGITEADLIPYRYPSDEELRRVGVTGIFLGYYLKWDARQQLKKVLATDFQVNLDTADVGDTPHQEGTFTNYENLDGKFVGVHDYLKFLKFGFGRATDHASIDIRNERIPREEAVELVRTYEGKVPRRYLDEYLQFVGMTEDEFYETLDAFTNKAIFETDENGRIVRDENGDVIMKISPAAPAPAPTTSE